MTTAGSFFEFEVLQAVRGELYTIKRDEWLASVPHLEERLEPYLESGAWREAVFARILLGWLKHAPVYRDLLADLAAVDAAQEARRAVGLGQVWDDFARRAADHPPARILPLCWEAILEYPGVWPEWKVVTFLRMLRAVPHVRSVEPLLAYLEGSTQYRQMKNAGLALAAIPQQDVAARLELYRSKHADMVQVLVEAAEDMEAGE